MQITLLEKQALEKWLQKNNSSIPVASGWVQFKGLELSQMNEITLEFLDDNLPSWGIRHKTLYKVHKKVATTRKYLRRPFMDPDIFPKIFRMQSFNLSTDGIRQLSHGQWGQLNPRGRSVSLSQKFSWGDSGNSGPLIMMGTWPDLSNAIGKAGDKLQFSYSSQNIDWYGDAEASFWISHVPGCLYAPTEEIGKVELNPRKEIMELAVGKVTGVFGNVASLQKGVEATATAIDYGASAYDAKQLFSVKRRDDTDKVVQTFVIGLYPLARQTETYVNTERTSLSGKEFLAYCGKLFVPS